MLRWQLWSYGDRVVLVSKGQTAKYSEKYLCLSDVCLTHHGNDKYCYHAINNQKKIIDINMLVPCHYIHNARLILRKYLENCE